jgi:hypothetical protein
MSSRKERNRKVIEIIRFVLHLTSIDSPFAEPRRKCIELCLQVGDVFVRENCRQVVSLQPVNNVGDDRAPRTVDTAARPFLLPVILATPGRRFAMGVCSPDAQASHGRFKFLNYQGVPG